MKNKILTLFFSACLVTASAADLYVNGSGNANTYTTIQAAVNASSDGDNIYISTVGTYNEEVTISNKSIFLIPAVADEQFKVANGVKFYAQNSSYETTIIGMWNATISTYNVNNYSDGQQRGTLNVIDCDINSISASAGDGTTNVYNSVVHNSALIKGNVSGCTFESGVSYVPGSPVGKFVGNKVEGNLTVSSGGYVEVSNNYIEDGYMWISSLRTTAGGANYINNNTINSISQGLLMPYSFISYNNTIIANNYIRTSSGSSSFNSYAIGTPQYGNASNFTSSLLGSNYLIANNYYSGFNYLVDNSSSTIIDNGTTSSNWTFSNTTGELTAGNGQDLGLDQIEFRDIDNSVNDIGTAGGPHAWSNYNPTTGKAAVVELDLPFQLYIGGNHDINAKAIHKN